VLNAKRALLLLVICALVGSRAYTETQFDTLEKRCPDQSCKNAVQFWKIAFQQKHALDAAKGKALRKEYGQNFFAYMLAGCDEVEKSRVGADALDMCAEARAHVSELEEMQQLTIKERALQIRSSVH